MNKVISTAFFLVAGTALSNAASVYTGVCDDTRLAYWSFDEGSMTPVSTHSNVAISISWNSGSTGTANTGASFSSGGVDGGAYVTFPSGMNPWGNLPSSNTLGDGTYNATNLTLSFFIKVNSDSSGTVFSFKGNTHANINVSGTDLCFYSGTTLSASYSLADYADQWVNVTFVSSWTAEEVLVYIDGKAQETPMTQHYLNDGTGAGIQLGNLFSGTANGGTGGQLTNVALDEVAVWLGGTNDRPTATQIATYSGAIPEPSSFGLLAGAGALVLVAARRRRSRSRKA